ncbi:MAG: sulfatase-like hydrolase/transferase [Planctomycetota bacterium]
MTPRQISLLLLATLCCLASANHLALAETANPLTDKPKTSLPNILWLTSEDNGPELGCYGDDYADTPNLDKLADDGIRYLNCWSNAPVCAPARTTIISGLFPTSLGGQHMRSEVALPDSLKLYPTLLRELGYYCTNNSKTDYNLATPKDLWNESSKTAHWRNRDDNQPFFAVFNFTISHESRLRTRPHKAVHDPAKVRIPLYHPDTPEVRQDWAQYYDRLTQMDAEAGRILKQLDEDGLSDNTIVFYYGDHGSGMPRGKRWLYQSGLRVPMIVRIPPQYQHVTPDSLTPGSESTRLISFVDLAPTLLSLAGQTPPETMHGKAFLGAKATEDPDFIYGFRDRMDERIDMSRAIRSQDYMYIRNFLPHRPQGAYLDYMFQTPTTQVWKRLFDEGKLNEAQSVFWKPKPLEEFYDLRHDPDQVRNLADEPEFQNQLADHRKALKEWMIRVNDLGLLPEGEMHQRVRDDTAIPTPYDLGTNSSGYDVTEVFPVADRATRNLNRPINELLSSVDHPDAAVRFWVANGLLIRATRGKPTNALLSPAETLLADRSPYVRCVAAETLARFGTSVQRKAALDILLALVNARKSGTFESMAALTSLDACRPSKKEIGTALEKLPKSDGTSPKRYGNYIPKLASRILDLAD